jgi:hypothetical protein
MLDGAGEQLVFSAPAFAFGVELLLESSGAGWTDTTTQCLTL